MWMPSSHVWVSPLAECTSSVPTITRIEATAGQKRCRMVIPDPQDSNRRLRPDTGTDRGTRGQTGLAANCRQTAPEIHVSLVCPCFGVHWDRRNFELVFASSHSDSQPESSPGLPASIFVSFQSPNKRITNVSRQKLSPSQAES